MVRAETMDPDNASILVAGGGGVALSVTRRLKDMGSWVWMLQRSDTRRCVLGGPSAYIPSLIEEVTRHKSSSTTRAVLSVTPDGGF